MRRDLETQILTRLQALEELSNCQVMSLRDGTNTVSYPSVLVDVLPRQVDPEIGVSPFFVFPVGLYALTYAPDDTDGSEVARLEGVLLNEARSWDISTYTATGYVIHGLLPSDGDIEIDEQEQGRTVALLVKVEKT